MNSVEAISERLKEIDVTGLPVIGKGGTAVIYRLDDERIAKVFFEHIDLHTVMNEQRACRSALKAGIPTVIPFELAKAGNCYAAVIELVNSATLAEQINADAANIRRYTDFVLGLNDIEVPENDFRAVKSQYLEMNEHARQYMTDEEFVCFTEIINGMPDGSGFIHGDCHAGNIMQQDGELLLIDMANAGYGHRILEAAGIYYDYVMVADISDPVKYLGLDRETCHLIWDSYISAYFSKYPSDNTQGFIDRVMKYAKLKGLLLTLPDRDLAKAFESYLRKLSEELLADR